MRERSRYGRLSPAVLVAVLFLSWGFTQDLSIRVGGATQSLSAVERGGVSYYSLEEVSRLLGLSLNGDRGRMTLAGPRGTLELQSSRPLVRSGGQYILLDSPCWERRPGEWYVPLDFVEKALPTILDRKMNRTGPRLFQLESVGENVVRVETIEYPDRLSVVFRMSRPADVEVREYRDYVDVAYRDSLVRPAAIGLPESPGIVSGITFEPQEAMGTFRVRKGPAFQRVRHLMLSDPPRLLLEVYGLPDSARGASPERDDVDASSAGVGGSGSDPAEGADRQPLPSRVLQEGLVVVDAGHGAEDYGVDSHQEVLEKVLALELAQKVERQLRADRNPVRLTRSRDVSIPLDQRAAIANFYQASAFVTIHLGSAPSPGIRGPMVYVLSASGEGDPDSHEGEEAGQFVDLLKAWNRAQEPYLSESRRLGHLMQGELNQLFETDNLVTEAPLVILEPIQAPAVLIETGFLTNPRDLELLNSPEFRDRLAAAIVRAVSRFMSAR